MRRTAAPRQPVKRVTLALLLLPAVAAGVWLLFFASGGSQPAVARATAAPGRAMQESPAIGRGRIYDRNFNTLALSFYASSLYARPLEISDPEKSATDLARILDLDRDQLLDSLRGERGFVWLHRQPDQEMVKQIMEGDFPGVYLMPRSHRYYPRASSTAHAVGFVKDGQGLAGIELAYDDTLRGAGADALPAAAGYPGRSGAGAETHLVSTLDLRLQQMLEPRLKRAMRSVDGRAASALLMEAGSGAILAMVSIPAYDPNRYWVHSTEERTNLALLPRVRPGALGEIFKLAAALEQAPGGAVLGWAAGADGDKAKSVGTWYELETNILASESLQQIAIGLGSEAVNEDFLGRLGLCGSIEFDLLDGAFAAEADLFNGPELPDRRRGNCRELVTDAAETRINAVALLAAFSRLVNGGRAVEPHLARGFWDGEFLRELNPGEGGIIFPARSGRDFSQALTALGSYGTGAPGVVFESLVLLEPRRDSGAPPPDEMAAGDPAVAASAELTKAPAREEIVIGEDRIKRYQIVMLGSAPLPEPSLAVLMFIDEARIDPVMPSPLAGVLRELPAWVETWQNPGAEPSAAMLAEQEADLYSRWLASREAVEFPVGVAGNSNLKRMPELLGLSLRKALQSMQGAGLRLTISGSGVVVAQHPAPGAELKGVEEGRIELRVVDRLAANGGRR